MWKSGSSPLFPVVFSPRDMVGKGEGFPHQGRIGMFSTRFQGGIHRKMWKGEVSWLRPRTTFANSGKSRQKHRKEPPVPSPPGALCCVQDYDCVPHVCGSFFLSSRMTNRISSSAAAAHNINNRCCCFYILEKKRQRSEKQRRFNISHDSSHVLRT